MPRGEGVAEKEKVLLYGGVVAVICGLMLITPETATGRGSLIPGVDVPPPPAVPASAGNVRREGRTRARQAFRGSCLPESVEWKPRAL